MKIRTRPFLWVIALAIPAPASAQTQPDPGDLPEFFAGTWTLKGHEQIFCETCKWLSPNSYMVCQGSNSDPEDPAQWITLLGYSHATKTYNFSAFDGSGAKSVFSGWLRGDVWVFTSEQESGSESIRTQVTITPTKDGFVLREEKSVNGAPWVVSLEEEHIRLPEATD